MWFAEQTSMKVDKEFMKFGRLIFDWNQLKSALQRAYSLNSAKENQAKTGLLLMLNL